MTPQPSARTAPSGKGSKNAGSPIELVIIRHGEAAIEPGRYPDHDTMPLSATGRRQAHALGRRLKKIDVSDIHASPFERAGETARILAKYADVRIRTDTRLRERVFPELQGMAYAAIARRHGRHFAKALRDGDSDTLTLPGCESLETCVARVQAAMDDIITRSRGDRVFVVTHGGPHDWYLQHALGLLANRPYRRLFRIDTCKVSIVALDRTRQLPIQIRAINTLP